MLVLSRKMNESIVINGNIIVTIAGFKTDGSVKIGITAPKEINVVRSELLEKDKDNNAS